MSEPSPEQSFTIHLKSLTDFADEFTTQIESLQAPMDHLATMSGTPPQYGAFHEAWSLGAGEQAAIEEMYTLLGQVKQAIAFAGDVTGTVADGYRDADQSVAVGLGGPPGGTTYGGGQNNDPWWTNNQYGGPNQQNPYGDPSQNNQTDQGGQNTGDQVYATPVAHTNGAAGAVPNQNTSGPFAAPPVTAAVPVVGALLGGALLGGVTKPKHHHQPSGTSSASVTFDAGSGTTAAGALPLWTPPPDPGAAASAPPAAPPAPVFPGQDAPWTATMPAAGQGGS